MRRLASYMVVFLEISESVIDIYYFLNDHLDELSFNGTHVSLPRMKSTKYWVRFNQSEIPSHSIRGKLTYHYDIFFGRK